MSKGKKNYEKIVPKKKKKLLTEIVNYFVDEIYILYIYIYTQKNYIYK